MQGVIKGGEKKPPRIVIYGSPKVGKTTLGTESPSPIFVPTEDGVSNVPVDRFEKATSWEEFLGNIAKVANDTHENKTLVIDTLNGAAELCAQYVCAKFYGGRWESKKGEPEGFLAFGAAKGWSAVSEEFRPLLALLDKVRDRGMIVLCLAHTGIMAVKNPLLGDYSKFGPDLDKRVWARVSAWADIIGRADYDYSVIGASDSKKGRAMGTSTRYVTFAGSAAEDAGCRVGYELPEKLDLSWAAIAASLGGKGELIAGIVENWPILSPEEATKTLKFLGVKTLDTLDAAPSQKLAQIHNSLKSKAAKAA